MKRSSTTELDSYSSSQSIFNEVVSPAKLRKMSERQEDGKEAKSVANASEREETNGDGEKADHWERTWNALDFDDGAFL